MVRQGRERGWCGLQVANNSAPMPRERTFQGQADDLELVFYNIQALH